MNKRLERGTKTGSKEELSVNKICKQVRNELNMSVQVSDEDVYEQIDKVILSAQEGRYLNLEEKRSLREETFNCLRRLDVLQKLLEDEEITEIMINSYDCIFIEKEGVITLTGLKFSSAERYEDVVQQIVSGANRMVNQTVPIADVRLQDGSRVNVILEPLALNGTTMTIRKFQDKGWNMERLIEKGALDKRMAEFLKILIKARYNIIVSGSTGSGKTTLLNLLSEYIPHTERIITIEDSAELNLKKLTNVVRLETKTANVEGEHEIKIGELIKASLRMRPDRIIVGEVRGEEAFYMINGAMNTGHDGSLSTCHANSCKDTVRRIETMLLMSNCEMPILAARRQIESAIDIIIHMGRLQDKSRKILEICEVDRMEGEEVILNPLFLFREGQEKNPEGFWEFINPLKHRKKLQLSGLDEDMNYLEKQEVIHD